MCCLMDEKQQEELIQYFLERETETRVKPSKFPPNYKRMQKDDFTEIHVDDLHFCLEQRLVTVRGQVIELTVKEFEIFSLLITNPKRVFTYEMLIDLVWNEDYTYYSRKAINNHVSNLRKKLKVDPDIPDYVKSVYGIGYKFDCF